MNAQEKAAKTAVLRTQFPVSSGSDHRSKESEWVPVTTTGASSASTAEDKVFYEPPSNVSSWLCGVCLSIVALKDCRTAGSPLWRTAVLREVGCEGLPYCGKSAAKDFHTALSLLCTVIHCQLSQLNHRTHNVQTNCAFLQACWFTFRFLCMHLLHVLS